MKREGEKFNVKTNDTLKKCPHCSNELHEEQISAIVECNKLVKEMKTNRTELKEIRKICKLKNKSSLVGNKGNKVLYIATLVRNAEENLLMIEDSLTVEATTENIAILKQSPENESQSDSDDEEHNPSDAKSQKKQQQEDEDASSSNSQAKSSGASKKANKRSDKKGKINEHEKAVSYLLMNAEQRDRYLSLQAEFMENSKLHHRYLESAQVLEMSQANRDKLLRYFKNHQGESGSHRLKFHGSATPDSCTCYTESKKYDSQPLSRKNKQYKLHMQDYLQ